MASSTNGTIKVGLQAGVASNREVGGATVLHDDKAGRVVVVETVGFGKKLARDTALDPELAISGELEPCPTATTLRAEHIGEL